VGWSDPGPWPRTARHIADELHQLLTAAAVPPPYLLVGHSVGGIIIRQFAVHHPELFAGLVFVDSSHENQNQRLAPYRDGGPHTMWRRAIRWQFKPLGIIRVATDLGITTQLRRDAERENPAGMADVGLALFRTSRHRRAVVQELIGFASGTAHGDPPDLGDLLLTVLTAGPGRRKRWYPAWREMQHELAALSSHSVHLIAEHSGHHMHLDDRAFVVGAIQDAIRRINRTDLRD
jgi:pimeloyl-ACP methyl ester carboxylesterase